MKSTEDFIRDLFRTRRQAVDGKALGMSPPQRLVVSFAVIILIGTILLLLPWAVPAGHHMNFIDALFTATSAVCVTGLIVRDTATAFSPFGQGIIMLLIKIGGLGYMILATSAAILLGRRMGVNERATIKQALNLETSEGMGRFVRNVIVVSLGVELLGAIIIAAAYWRDFSPGRAIALGVFHAISGFNNAGFCLFSENLMGAAGKPVVATTIVLLAVVGGLGFFVFHEIIHILRGMRKKISIHTKLVLITSLALIVLGAVGLYFTAEMHWGQAFFLSSIARTAGFNIQDTGKLAFRAQMILIPLMFIGASPGGTGGGIKTTTFAVIILAIWATVRGKNEVVAFHRRIPTETIYKALMIFVVMTVILVGLSLTLEILENRSIGSVLFETASALGTVGLSVGNGGNLSLSALFSVPGKILIVIAMFIGRLGPLTLGLAAAFQSQHPQVKYPEGRVSIG